jgi:hypothetical protein
VLRGVGYLTVLGGGKEFRNVGIDIAFALTHQKSRSRLLRKRGIGHRLSPLLEANISSVERSDARIEVKSAQVQHSESQKVL